MSAITDNMAALANAFNTSFTALTDAAFRKVATAALADNANTLGNQTPTQLTATAAAHTDAHASNTNNPHGTTAAAIGAYTEAQIDALIASLLPSGIIPLSRFGAVDGSSLPVTFNGAAASVTFAANIPVLIAGQFFLLPQIVISGVTAATTYLYLRLTSGVPSIVASLTEVAESQTNMYIGAVACSGGTFTQNTILAAGVTRIDLSRISTTAAGSAIPVSTGLPSETAHLAWT